MRRNRRKEFTSAVESLEPGATVIFADRLPCAYAVALVWLGWILVDTDRLRTMSREEIVDLAAHEVAHLRAYKKHGDAAHGPRWRDEYEAALDEVENG